MLKYITLLFFLLPFLSSAQDTEPSDKIYYGANISLGASSYINWGENIFAPMIEVGGFINSKATEKISFNFGLNLTYFPEHNHEYDYFSFFDDIGFPYDTIQTGRTGVFKQEAAMISIPLRMEFNLTRNNRLGLIGGVVPSFDYTTRLVGNTEVQ